MALAFAKFADGRAFSYARLLRDRYGFRGELRAIGDVLIDEIPLMLRCGFDSFDVTNASTLKALEAHRLPGSPFTISRAAAETKPRRRAAVADNLGRPGWYPPSPERRRSSDRARKARLPPCGRRWPEGPDEGYSAQPLSSRRATASMTASPSALSLRQGIAAKCSPPASRK